MRHHRSVLVLERIVAGVAVIGLVVGIVVGYRYPSQIVITAPEPWRPIKIIQLPPDNGGNHAP